MHVYRKRPLWSGWGAETVHLCLSASYWFPSQQPSPPLGLTGWLWLSWECSVQAWIQAPLWGAGRILGGDPKMLRKPCFDHIRLSIHKSIFTFYLFVVQVFCWMLFLTPPSAFTRLATSTSKTLVLSFIQFFLLSFVLFGWFRIFLVSFFICNDFIINFGFFWSITFWGVGRSHSICPSYPYLLYVRPWLSGSVEDASSDSSRSHRTL